MVKTVVSDLFKIFNSGVSAVLPDQLIRRAVQYNPISEQLKIINENYCLKNKNVHLVGTGKAVQSMAIEIQNILKSKIESGIISIPVGSLSKSLNNSNILFCEGAKNNLPDLQAETNAKAITDLALKLKDNDILIVLISGGGSALLPLPKGPITLQEKTMLITKLANLGADIKELNVVRKQISGIKGGQLAIKACPANVISLILSDIVGDPLDLIASGPTVENMDLPSTAVQIMTKYNIYDELPESVKSVLNETRNIQPFPKDKVKNIVIGSNTLSIAAALHEAINLKYTSLGLSNIITGNVKDVARKYAKLSKAICDFFNCKMDKISLKSYIKQIDIPGLNLNVVDNIKTLGEKGICLVFGGEITVEVRGKGKGGRNQQLALEFSNFLYFMKDSIKEFEIYLLSAGTDGIDGPTDAAGAIGYHDLVLDSRNDNFDIQEYLDNNDSYNFYKHFMNGNLHVITGHTGTNVMDIHLIIIKKK